MSDDDYDLEDHEAGDCDDCAPDPNDPRTIEPSVLYWKKGADFGRCLEAKGGNVPDALELWAGELEKSAQGLRALAAAIREKAPGATAWGDTHGAEISVPAEVGRELKAREDLKPAICFWEAR